MISNVGLFHYLITVITLSVQLISIYYSLATCQINLFMLIRERFRGPDSKGDSDDGKSYHIWESGAHNMAYWRSFCNWKFKSCFHL